MSLAKLLDFTTKGLPHRFGRSSPADVDLLDKEAKPPKNGVYDIFEPIRLQMHIGTSISQSYFVYRHIGDFHLATFH
jgi:hypothetical protein